MDCTVLDLFFLLNVLFESFVIEIKVPHRFFFISIRDTIELVLEGLIIILEFVLHFLFLRLEFFNGINLEMLAIDLLSI